MVRLEGPEVSQEQLSRLPSATPVAELRAALGGALPSAAPIQGTPLFALGALYSLAVVLLLRFAGLPGLLGSLLLAPLVALSAWSLARPGAALQERSSTLVLAGGALAREDLASSLLSLPARSLELSANARPGAPTRYRQTWDTLELGLGRWQALRLEHRPSLLRAAFTWDGGDLVNRGSSELREVIVLGLGPQEALEPGARLLPRPQEEGPLPDDYARLAAALPPGSALARDGSAVLVALPDAEPRGRVP